MVNGSTSPATGIAVIGSRQFIGWASMRAERLARLSAAILIAQIPFELQDTLLGLTNLQWSFVAVALIGIPLLIENRKKLVHDRLVQALAGFIGIQWAAAAY